MSSILSKSPSKNSQNKHVFKQGDLDGLCAIYSLVNAAALIRPSDTKKSSQRLFKKLLRSFSNRHSWHAYVTYGLEFRDVKRALKVIDGVRGRVHYCKQDAVSLDDFWQKMQEFLSKDKQRCVLLGLQGKHDHWTLIESISDTQLHLVDSIGLKVLRRQSCCTPTEMQKTHIFVPHQSLFLEAESVTMT